MNFCLYRSKSVITTASSAYDDIFFAARQKNREANISGYLHWEDGCFVQYIEGPERPMSAILETIMNDARHEGFKTLASGPIDRRRFGRWDMALDSTDFSLFSRWRNGRTAFTFRKAPVEVILSFFSHNDQNG